ncbi:CD109 antigen-like [Argopecten irradians]|uniref:CD109 antigen-like n=1 Tax=Argopecten irradians TaxID=31199 RepID=UPI0037107B22
MTSTVQLFIVVLFTSVLAKNSYFILTPRYIRPSQSLTVLVKILKADGPVQVDLKVTNNRNKTISTVTDMVNRGIPKVLKLQIPDTLPSPGIYRLSAKGTRGLRFSDNVYLVYLPKASSLFVQTDKAVYRQGERVRIKAIGIYPSLQVVHSPMNVTIFDSKNNRIKQWIDYIDPTSRVFKGELQLNEVTNTGDWRIDVEQQTTKKSDVFEVREFVLPRFEVSIDIPSFAITTDEHFKIKVSAQYTFGKPVRGKLDVAVERTWSSDRKIGLHFKDFNGEMEFYVSMKHVTSTLSTYSVRVTATVTEGLTDEEISDTSDVRLYSYLEKLSFPSTMPRIYKPGLVCEGILRVTQQDNSVLPNVSGMVSITVTYYATSPVPAGKSTSGKFVIDSSSVRKRLTMFKSITKNGFVKFDFTIPPDVRSGSSVTIRANYRAASAYAYIRNARSSSNTFLQVRLKTKPTKLKAGKRAKFVLRSTQQMSLVEYQIFSKNELVEHGHVDADKKKSKTFTVQLTQSMAPKAVLLVYFVRNNGEIVSDSITFDVKGLFKNDASIKFNKKKVQPNERVELKLKAAPGSEMHVLAIDKRVLLLKKGNDITQSDVQNEIQRFGNGISSLSTGVDTASILRNAAVLLMTDIVESEEPQTGNQETTTTTTTTSRPSSPRPTTTAVQTTTTEGEEVLSSTLGTTTTTESDVRPQQPSRPPVTTTARIRKKFFETWIWTEIIAGDNGKATLSRKVPDSITTWVASMFASDTKTGLGVAPSSAEIAVFKDEFLQIVVPRSAIRGEIIVVQVDFFNYGNKDMEGVVILKKTNEFYFADPAGRRFTPNDRKFPGTWAKTLTVKSDDTGSVFFPIVPLVIGEMDLTLLAKAKKKTDKKFKDIDALRKPIKIKAEGIRQSYTLQSLKVLKGDPVSETLNITFPKYHVSGSEYIQVSAIGDIMGPSLAGIEDLLQMSYGCGEQNLLNFVPNVFVTKYLRVTSRLTPEVKERTENLLAAGYQRELIYKRFDGSFSAFGNRDRSGSTWLTAFVVKTFAQAKNDTSIDPDVMEDAIRFLLRYQRSDGSFYEPGIVFHKGMQGGSISSTRARTSFVLAAIVEANQLDFLNERMSQLLTNATMQAVNFLTKGGVQSFRNTYELGITAYALTLVDRNLTILEEMFAELDTRATIQDGQKYWILSSNEAAAVNPYKSSWRPPITRSRALDIEVTAYIMLAFVERNDVTNGLQVLKWLVTQQNSRGGFVSTQDTVIALQAFANLAEIVYEDNFSISVNVESSPGTFSHIFSVTNNNALVLQIAEIPYVNNTQELTVSATGTGICLVEVSVFFNVEEELREPAFAMNTTLRNETMEGFQTGCLLPVAARRAEYNGSFRCGFSDGDGRGYYYNKNKCCTNF